MSRTAGKHAARRSRWRTAALGLLTGGLIVASGLAPTVPAMAADATFTLTIDPTAAGFPVVTAVTSGKITPGNFILTATRPGFATITVPCGTVSTCVKGIALPAGGKWTITATADGFVPATKVVSVTPWTPTFVENDDGTVTVFYPYAAATNTTVGFSIDRVSPNPSSSISAGGGSGASTQFASLDLEAGLFLPGTEYNIIALYDSDIPGELQAIGPRVVLKFFPGAIAAPTGMTAIAGVGQVATSWTPPADAIAGETVYNVDIRNNFTGEVEQRTTTDTSLLFDDLDNGTSYDFWVSTVNGANESQPTPVVNATPITAPAAPILSDLTPGDTRVSVSAVFPSTEASPSEAVDARWEVSVDGEEFDVIGAPIAQPMIFSNLKNGSVYIIRVQARNSVGQSAWVTLAAVVPVAGLVLPPAAPTVANEAAKQSTLSVDLTLPTTSGAVATGATWQLGTVQADNSVKWENAFPTMTGTTAVFTGLTDGVDYFVRAQSTNAAGTSPWATSAVLRPISAPAAPTVEKAVADSGTLLVNLAATSGSDARPIVGYVWKVAATTGATAGVWQFVTAASTSEGYLITSLIPGVQYDIQFAATNPAGASEWAVWSPTASPVDGSAGNGSSGADHSSDNGSAGDESGIDVPNDSDSNGADSAEPTSDELDDISTSDPDGGSGSPSSDLMSSVDSASIVSTLTGGTVGRGTADELDRGTDSTSLGATLPAHRSNVALRSILIATALLLLFLIAFGFWWLLLLARRRKKEQEDMDAAEIAAALAEEATAVQ